MAWQAWKIDRALDDPETIHVRPRADTRWHPLDGGCWCGPQHEDLTDGGRPDGAFLARLVLHQPADGREPVGRVEYVTEGPTVLWDGTRIDPDPDPGA